MDGTDTERRRYEMVVRGRLSDRFATSASSWSTSMPSNSTRATPADAEGPPSLTDEARLIAALRRGDEWAFAQLIDSYSAAMLRVARTFVPSQAVAEEVVQEAWIAVLNGIDRFEGRSSLKTWIFKILTNTARTRGERERRTVPLSSLAGGELDGGPSVDPDRFLPPDHDRFPGHWALGPSQWQTPDEGLLEGETREVLLRAIESSPRRNGG